MKVQRFILAACLWTGGLGIASAQTLELIPNRVLVDESAVIRARGLEPNERISIQAELVDGADEPWSAQAEFIVDAQGAVDTSQQAPVKGSYEGVSAMGLIWSMKPAAKHVASYRPPRDLGSQIIKFQLMRNGQQVTSAQMEQRGVAEGVQQIKVEGQLHGVLLLPNTKERHPGVLVVGGSEGGMPLGKAAWLASRGYAALALAYFRYDDLPPLLEGIPLEYFGSALAWMMQRPEILPDRIAVVGTSRGGELALQLGSMYPQIKAVVAYVPANVRRAACCGNTRDLKYPHAGHRAGRPEIVPTWHGNVRNPTSGREENLGGRPQGDAQSSLDAIPKVLEFLRESLLDHNSEK
jgi:hypothetical protein